MPAIFTYLLTCIICQTSNTYHDFPGLNISVGTIDICKT